MGFDKRLSYGFRRVLQGFDTGVVGALTILIEVLQCYICFRVLGCPCQRAKAQGCQFLQTRGLSQNHPKQTAKRLVTTATKQRSRKNHHQYIASPCKPMWPAKPSPPAIHTITSAFTGISIAFIILTSNTALNPKP